MRWAFFSQERSHVQALQWEGHMAANLERIHDLMPEAFQVNAQNLWKSKYFAIFDTISQLFTSLTAVHVVPWGENEC